MYTRKNKMKGGMIQKNPGISSWEAVYKMICAAGATLSSISFGSAKGFIFRLDVPHDKANSEFFGLDMRRFNKPIYSLVFKFSLIDNTTTLNLDALTVEKDGTDIITDKSTETLDTFMDEVSKQQYIYRGTILPQGKPITLAVVDFSYFNDIFSLKLLSQLGKLPSNKPQKIDIISLNMLKYLYKTIETQNSLQLGLITMELANDDFDQLNKVKEYVDTNPISEPIYDTDCEYIWAQLLILFVKLKIINYDCHDENVLASKAPITTSKSFGEDIIQDKRSILIDFGRCVNLKNVTSQDLFKEFTQQENTKFNVKYSEITTGRNFYTDLTELRQIVITDLYVSRNQTPIDLMVKIIKFMAYVDYSILLTQYNAPEHIPQMKVLLSYIFPSLFASTNDWEVDKPIDSFWVFDYRTLEKIQQKYIELTESSHQRNSLSLHIPTIFNIDSSVSYDRSIPGSSLDNNNTSYICPQIPVTAQPGAAQRPANRQLASPQAASWSNYIGKCVGAFCPIKLKTNGGTRHRRKRDTRKKYKNTRRR